MMKIKHNSALMLVPVLLLVMAPHSSFAAFTFQDKSFDSFESYVTFVAEYLIIWRELHGQGAATTTRTIVTPEPSPVSSVDVDTRLPDDVTSHEARLQGRIRLEKNDNASVWFEYGTSSRKLTTTTPREYREGTDRSNRFDQKIQKLVDDQVYYYRAVAENDQGVRFYGKVRTFLTPVDPRIQRSALRVQTLSATDVDEARATFRARLDWRDEPYMYVWFEYGEEDNELYETTPIRRVFDTHPRDYERTVRRLEQRQTYYYRAVGEDADGSRSYGVVKRFTTKRDIENETPKITVKRADNITLHTAVVRATIDMNDFNEGITFLVYGEDREEINEVDERYDRYRQIREYGDERQKVLLDDDLDRFDTYEVKLTGLDLDTTHYYAFGVSYEDENEDDVLLLSRTQSFKTKR